MKDDSKAIGILGKLFTMTEKELRTAKTLTDNDKFKKILQDTLDARFPNKLQYEPVRHSSGGENI